MKILILAGTEDGRELAAVLMERGHEVLVSTLTAYGANIAKEQGLQARSGAMDAQILTELIISGSFAVLVDATHPYAERVKETAKAVCQELAVPYLRWERSALAIGIHRQIHWAENIPAAAQIAAELGQKIMLTTGSNGLSEWVSQPCLRNKELFVRVLSTAQVLARCESLGLKPKQIIAAQGPFSQEWDEAMFKQLDIDVVVSKESGKVGGTLAKIQACLSLNLPLVILKRPLSTASDTSISQFIESLEEIICNQRSYS